MSEDTILPPPSPRDRRDALIRLTDSLSNVCALGIFTRNDIDITALYDRAIRAIHRNGRRPRNARDGRICACGCHATGRRRPRPRPKSRSGAAAGTHPHAAAIAARRGTSPETKLTGSARKRPRK